MKCSIILFFFLSLFVSNSLTKLGNVRYCRNHVRRCSRNRFGLFITTKLNKTTSDTASNATAPGATGATGATPEPTAGATPSTVSPPSRRKRGGAEAKTWLDGKGRRKRQDANTNTTAAPPEGASSVASAGNETGGAAAEPAATTLGTTTEPPSWPLPTPQIFTLKDLEETFYSCLDDLGVGRCKLYMAQRCNWHNGKSTVLAGYCKKWGIPCKPCAQG